mmetsp:Transcript_111169/g.358910  ORF Transcript_111169/g.358910 Transcript_111169/m.358910 type:complete len:203 (+) Transcript_111169:504-1112(+)
MGAAVWAATPAPPPPPPPMTKDASRATSSYTFFSSESISVSSSGSEKPSSMTSSATRALFISFCISSIVRCISGTFSIWLASFIMAVDIFTALAEDIVAICVVKWRFMAVIESLVFSSLATDFRRRTMFLAVFCTCSALPCLASTWISLICFTSSLRIWFTSRSSWRISDLICLCHSRAFSLPRCHSETHASFFSLDRPLPQ